MSSKGVGVEVGVRVTVRVRVRKKGGKILDLQNTYNHAGKCKTGGKEEDTGRRGQLYAYIRIVLVDLCR